MKTNRDRAIVIFWGIIVYFSILVAFALGGSFDVYHLWSVAGVLACLAYVALRFGLYSSSFLLSFFFAYPGFAVAYANLFGGNYIKSYNRFLQDDVFLVNMAALLFFSGCVSLVMVLHFASKSRKERQLERLPAIGGEISLIANRRSVLNRFTCTCFCIGVVLFSLLMEQGGTLLNQSYGELRIDRTNTSFASGLFALFWVLAFLGYQKGFCKQLFIVCTAIAAIWLMLHGKRAPLLGIAFIMLSWFAARRQINVRVMVGTALIVLALFVIGEVRSNALANYTTSTFFQELSSVSGDTVELPGNGAGIYLTYLGTLYLMESQLVPELGSTYLSEMVGIVPGPLLNLVGVTPYGGFGPEVYAESLPYVGGMHVLSVGYANFLMAGIVMIGAIAGLVFTFVRRSLAGVSEMRTAVSFLLIMLGPAALWYNGFILVSWSLYAILFIFALQRVVPRAASRRLSDGRRVNG